jgi:predicted permease
MGTLWQDIRYGFRMLVRSPGFAAVVVLTLALGIGATTAVFSIVNAVLLRPLAYPQSGRLVCLHEIIPALADKYPLFPVNARHFMEWRQRCSSFESLSVVSLFTSGPMTLTGRAEPQSLASLQVSANVFETLAVQPALGRTFMAQEETDAQHHVVIISDRLWRRTFHADPSIIGASVMLDNEVYTIIGVLPARFRFPTANEVGVPWVAGGAEPQIFTPKVFSSADQKELMGMFNHGVIARLKGGVTGEQALAELNVIAPQLEKMAGENVGLRAALKPLKAAIVEKSGRGLFILLGAIGSVLLIACLNLAILNLVRAERRSFDSAVRIALGASRVGLLRQALIEALLLAALGTFLGVAVAAMGLDTLIALSPADTPRLDEVRIDGRVLLFALALTVTTSLLFGLLPAWRMAQNRGEHLFAAARRTATATAGAVRLRGMFVATQVSLGVMLLITAGLLLGSFSRVVQADRGFHAPTVLASEISLPAGKYGDMEQAYQFYERLVESLSASPGIHSAAIVTALPLQGETYVDGAWLPGDSRPSFERPMANVRFISSDYFRAMGIPLLSGRTFDETDRTRRVAVISERVAWTLWPGQNPLGRSFARNEKETFEVIGVVGDVRANVDKQPVTTVYRPYWEAASACNALSMVVVARPMRDALSIAGTVRQAVHNADSDVAIARMRTMNELLAESLSSRRFQMLLASAFAASALVLAGLGVYGVVSCSVTRRTREIGIRAAFGALPRHLYAMVLRQGMAPVALGLVAGVAGALAIGRFLRSLLYEVSPYDPWIIAAAAAVTFLMAVAASYLPARRAARIDPMVALRYE